MSSITQLRSLTADQRNAFAAAFLGWMLDAFDYFVLVFVLKDVAATFHVDKTKVAFALMLTLACRPIGALIFGWAADRFGRRTPLMVNIVCYSVLSLLAGFAPTLTAFLVLRALFGIAMGGEWGLGTSLAMESIPPETRGTLSGLLQEGYVVGYLVAAVVFRFVFPYLGWRGMFWVGIAPALLSLFIRAKVKESAVWEETRRTRQAQGTEVGIGTLVQQHAGLFCYLVLLMAAFNFMSHGTQDVYPTFLQVQHGFKTETVSNIAIIYNIGALIGGIFFGTLSQKIGRRKAIVIAALLGLPIVPLWAYSPTAGSLAAGAFAMQFMVQGAWGVIPAHLSELAPTALRSTFIGLTYQLGNLIASINGPLQTHMAEANHNNFSAALGSVVAVVLVAVAAITALGRESHGSKF